MNIPEKIEEIAVLIPAYNESGKIGAVIERVKAQGYIPGNIIVVDDGSADSTAEIARKAGVSLIEHDSNKGKGAALNTGFRWAIEQPGLSAVITMDADGQHSPEFMHDFVKVFRERKDQIIIGSRMHDIEDMPLIRKLTNRITSAIISSRAGSRITDSQSGFRLISLELLSRIGKIESNHYDAESELLIRAAGAGAAISEIPIDTIYSDETSSINPLVDTFRFICLVIRSYFW